MKFIVRTFGFALAAFALLLGLLPLAPMSIASAAPAPCHHCPEAPASSPSHSSHTCCIAGHNQVLASQMAGVPPLAVAHLSHGESETVFQIAVACIAPALIDTSPLANSPIRI